MNCTECKNLIEKYMDGMIDDTQLEAVRQHAQQCSTCRAEFEAVGNMQGVLKGALAGGISAGQAKDAILSEVASGRIKADRTTFSPAVSVGRWASIAAGIALAGGLLLGLALSKVSEPRLAAPDKALLVPIEIRSLEGTVLVKHSNLQTWEELKSSASVYLGDVFHSAAKSGFVLTFKDGSTMELNPNTTLTLKLYNGGTEFYLEHGVVAAALNNPHPSFVVSTPHGRVEALGTEFTVSVK